MMLMKNLLVILIILTSGASAQDEINLKNELKIIENISKELRKELWQSGHIDVDSSSTLVDQKFLHNYTSNSQNQSYLVPLTEQEISRLYQCLFNSDCTLYHIRLTSSYHSGWGEESAFVLLKRHVHKLIRHVVYSE